MSILKSIILGTATVLILRGFGLEWNQPIWWILMILLNILFVLLFNKPKDKR